MTLDELIERQESERERQRKLKRRILCCTAAGCMSCGAESVRKAVAAEIQAEGKEAEMEVCGTGCMGLCSRGPLVRTSDDGALYGNVDAEDAAALVSEAPAAYARLGVKRIDTSAPFFTKQKKIVLAHSGEVDPERLNDYIAAGGYQALGRALAEMTPEEVIAEIRKSGLRGRGGAGYPTALKWELVAKQSATPKYVVCNADEGDPGAFMDRSILEGDPHLVLEGMAIAGYAVGAQQGYIYVRGEYALAIQRLQAAIRQAERERLLGSRVFDESFQFRIDLRIGAGAFVCGEETALIASIEGRRGQPRQRPPYPPESGLWGQPTLINNVETFANVAPILLNGGEWFASIGSGASKGTKVFALAGKIANTGLIEVPMGIPLREIIFDIGGGVPGGGGFKAAQTGGPSGGCIPAEYLDTPVDYESLAAIGSIMGSGGLIVMDQASSMVDVARFFMEFCMDESCGKCIPCRAGTVQMHDILTRILQGEGAPDDIEMLERLCVVLRETSLCGLGQTAPNPVLSTLKYFRHEYEQLVQPKPAAAGGES
ncbi:MAG: NADH dehydrogenase [Bryobacteraceae bacterium]|nr:MAG: NADH dehydrogenase [Bryobacteraceae bacterium]